MRGEALVRSPSSGADRAPRRLALLLQLEPHPDVVTAAEHVVEVRIGHTRLRIPLGDGPKIHDPRLGIEQIIDTEAQLPVVPERVATGRVEDVVARRLVILRRGTNHPLRLDARQMPPAEAGAP